MKTIKTQGQITSITAKQDRSLGLRVTTPELSPQEKAVFMELQGLNLDIAFTPLDFESREVMEVKSEVDSKTPSQRLRSCIFVLYDQKGRPGEFSDFYTSEMNKIIDTIKGKLE